MSFRYPPEHAVAVRRAPGEDGRAGRRADTARRIALGESQPLFRELVEMRRLDPRVAVTGQVPPSQIVRQKNDKVRLAGAWFASAERQGGCQRQCDSEEEHSLRRKHHDPAFAFVGAVRCLTTDCAEYTEVSRLKWLGRLRGNKRLHRLARRPVRFARVGCDMMLLGNSHRAYGCRRRIVEGLAQVAKYTIVR